MGKDSTPPHVTIDLNPLKYQSSLGAYRMLLERANENDFLVTALRTPRDEEINFQVRVEDAYIVGFRGADGWCALRGQKGAWGSPCGVGANYSDLGTVGRITYDDLKNLGDLAKFRAGAPLDKRLLAISAAITSEAARFATVATYFTGLTNSVGTVHSPYLKGGVDFERLRREYFTQWQKPPAGSVTPGNVHHFARGEILIPRMR
jgi:hypothetical protein